MELQWIPTDGATFARRARPFVTVQSVTTGSVTNVEGSIGSEASRR